MLKLLRLTLPTLLWFGVVLGLMLVVSRLAQVTAPPRQIPAFLPTYADGTTYELGTPDPLEKVKVGPARNIAVPIERQIKYAINSQHLESISESRRSIFITDPITGRTVQLGDQNGMSMYGAQSPDYFLWFFVCQTSCPTIKNGLHVYSVAQGEDSLISETAMRSFESLKISGPWATYVEPRSQMTVALYAYNALTGEHILIGENLIKPLSNIGRYYALNEETVAWVSTRPEHPEQRLNVFSLSTRQPKSFDIQPDWKGFPTLKVSSELIIWQWDFAWKGYDLSQDALFTIPEKPPVPGLQNVVVLEIRPQEGNIVWIVDAFWGKRAYLAPVVEIGSEQR
jgi:hypothetical protein